MTLDDIRNNSLRNAYAQQNQWGALGNPYAQQNQLGALYGALAQDMMAKGGGAIPQFRANRQILRARRIDVEANSTEDGVKYRVVVRKEDGTPEYSVADISADKLGDELTAAAVYVRMNI